MVARTAGRGACRQRRFRAFESLARGGSLRGTVWSELRRHRHRINRERCRCRGIGAIRMHRVRRRNMRVGVVAFFVHSQRGALRNGSGAARHRLIAQWSTPFARHDCRQRASGGPPKRLGTRGRSRNDPGHRSCSAFLLAHARSAVCCRTQPRVVSGEAAARGERSLYEAFCAARSRRKSARRGAAGRSFARWADLSQARDWGGRLRAGARRGGAGRGGQSGGAVAVWAPRSLSSYVPNGKTTA